MGLGTRAKDETGKVYGIWYVNNIIQPREMTNRCIKYELICVKCGAVKYANGNNLRFGRYAHKCKNCGART